jgi:hypothetical protein
MRYSRKAVEKPKEEAPLEIDEDEISEVIDAIEDDDE